MRIRDAIDECRKEDGSIDYKKLHEITKKMVDGSEYSPTMTDAEAERLVSNILHPHSLKELKQALIGIPDENLEKFVIFKFVWGSREGTIEWTRKEKPKQYWRNTPE